MYTVAALQLASTCFFAWESRPEDKDERTPGAGAGAGGDEAKKAIQYVVLRCRDNELFTRM